MNITFMTLCFLSARAFSFPVSTRLHQLHRTRPFLKNLAAASNVGEDSNNGMIRITVGGIPYYVEKSVLSRYPKSIFPTLFGTVDKEDTNQSLVIQRNGKLFRYVYDYMTYRKLPRDENGSAIFTRDQLKQIQTEAEYYQLPGLIQECKVLQKEDTLLEQLNIYESFRKQVEDVEETCVWSPGCKARNNVVFQDFEETENYEDEDEDDYEDEDEDDEDEDEDEDEDDDDEDEDENEDEEDEDEEDEEDEKAKYKYFQIGDDRPELLSILNSLETVPAWITGTIPKSIGKAPVYKSTTVWKVNVPELLQTATPSPFGQGKNTRYDPSVRNSTEIHSNQLLNLSTIISSFDIAAMAPSRQLVLKPYKLVVYNKGGHFKQHRDTVREENHIGTLVLILNSEYTGGELELSHGGMSVNVTGGGNWVAMYGDVIHHIHPVTSGTRVSLIFDILSLPLSSSDPGNRNHKAVSKSEIVPFIETTIRNRIFSAIDNRLETHDTVSISLSHLYPAGQANADFLKGGDLALYNALVARYDVCTTPILISRVYNYEDGVRIYYREFKLAQKLASRSGDKKLPQFGKENLLYIPKYLEHSKILSYNPAIEYTGNEAQDKNTVYLATALIVRKKNPKKIAKVTKDPPTASPKNEKEENNK